MEGYGEIMSTNDKFKELYGIKLFPEFPVSKVYEFMISKVKPFCNAEQYYCGKCKRMHYNTGRLFVLHCREFVVDNERTDKRLAHYFDAMPALLKFWKEENFKVQGQRLEITTEKFAIELQDRYFAVVIETGGDIEIIGNSYGLVKGFKSVDDLYSYIRSVYACKWTDPNDSCMPKIIVFKMDIIEVVKSKKFEKKEDLELL